MRTWRKPPAIERPWLRYGLLVFTLIYLYFAVGSYDVNWARVAEGMPRGVLYTSQLKAQSTLLAKAGAHSFGRGSLSSCSGAWYTKVWIYFEKGKKGVCVCLCVCVRAPVPHKCLL